VVRLYSNSSKTYFINGNHDDASAYSVLNRNHINNIHEIFPKIKKYKKTNNVRR